ncbi:MAG: glycosyltransferase family 2 protein [Geminocystis sp.]|nr:glycosyltransferase family 2 protein [Geminocystis sp.]MDW8464020.1 glycosyltransferase family 2 protein [Geminocystis sp.]
MNDDGNFIPPYPLTTAVLFLVFKRLDTTKNVFEFIRKAKPPRLYIAADGPRERVEGEAEKVQAVRDYLMRNIDWNCEVKTLFRDKNLGCGRAVSEAITWFFEHEEMGIILEDDTVPSLSFFWFCEELLKRYKDENRVFHIAGYSLQSGLFHESYRFSRLVPIWGWATWRRAWKFYDFEMLNFNSITEADYEYFGDYKKDVMNTFYYQYKSRIDTWDIQWAFTCVFNRALTIIPRVSLVKNIGFGKESTHTKKVDKYNSLVKNQEVEFPLIHPKSLEPDRELDLDYLRMFYHKSMLQKIKHSIKSLFYKGV